MTDDFLSVNFNRLTSLKAEMQEVSDNYRVVREQLQSLRLRYENLERFLAAEVYAIGSPALNAKFNEIIGDDGTSRYETGTSPMLNKSDFLVKILYQENLLGRGVTPKELFDLTEQTAERGNISLEYTNSVLGKLKKRGVLEQKNRRYFLTEAGKKVINDDQN